MLFQSFELASLGLIFSSTVRSTHFSTALSRYAPQLPDLSGNKHCSCWGPNLWDQDSMETSSKKTLSVRMGMHACSLALTFFLCGAAAGIQCDFQGECVGQLIGFTSLNTSEQCLDTCIGKFTKYNCLIKAIWSNLISETRGCAWFTYGKQEQFCNLMRTCDDVHGCESCNSGN